MRSCAGFSRNAGLRVGRAVSQRWLALAAAGLLLVLAIDQLHLLLGHARHWANEDHTLLWVSAQDVGHGHLFQPNYYGQSYFTWLGAIPTELLHWLSLPLATASAAASALLAIGSWLALAVAAWHRQRPWFALLAIAAPIVLSTDSLVAASSAGGRDAGSFAACLGAALLLWSPRSARHVALFTVVAGLGVAWDFGSALLVAPVATYALFSNLQDRRVLRAGAVGLVAPAAWLIGTNLFYRAHPDYDSFKSGTFVPGWHAFANGIEHIGRYLAPAEPELLRWFAVPLLVGLVLTVALVRTRRLAYALPPLVGIGGFLYALSTTKIQYAVDSDYLWYGRFFLELPLLLWFLAFLAHESHALRFPAARSPVVLGVIVALAAATFAVRTATFDHRMSDVVSQAHRVAFGAVLPVDQIERRCDDLAAAAKSENTDLVVFIGDAWRTYGCEALHYGDVRTLLPSGDRRTWRLSDEDRRARTRVIIGDPDPSFCRNLHGMAVCSPLPEAPGAELLHFSPQSIIDLWRHLGLPVRAFGGHAASRERSER